MPSGLLERVAHYATPSPPTHPARSLRMRLQNTVAPSPSSTISTKSSEGVAVPTPAALRGSKPSARATEAKKLREEALRLQEEQEEKELKLRRRVSGRGKWAWHVSAVVVWL